jgi:hypothetical protein
MSYFLYNAAPGPMYFLGNEIKAEPSKWMQVSDYAVNHGTFNSMKRMKLVYVIEADDLPTYDPTHPDNKTLVESQSPGAVADKKAKLDDGGMTEAELKAFLASKNSDKPRVSVTSLSGKTEAITADNLADIGRPPAAFDGPAAETTSEVEAGLKFEELGETVPFVKEAKAAKPKAVKKADKAETPSATATPENLGSWS